MIISVEELKQHITTDKTDQVLEAMLQALELSIRKYTNNNFQNRNKRFRADIVDGSLNSFSYPWLSEGDTVQISESKLNDGLYILSGNMGLLDEEDVLVTKVVYPADVIDCCCNLMEWEVNHRGKVGIKSETLSRHSVTYEDSASMFMGYPAALLGCLKSYRKVRF